MKTGDGLIRREDFNTRSVQELRNTIEVSGVQSLSAVFSNDTVIMHTPLVAGDTCTIPSDGRIGTMVSYVNVGEVDGKVSDGTSSWTLEAGQGMVFILSGVKWIPTANAEVLQVELDAIESRVAEKSTIFYQADPPTSLESEEGDMWVDTNNDNVVSVYGGAGTGWVNGSTYDAIQALSDAYDAFVVATNAQSTADGKITAYYQDGTPSGGEEGDIWFNTTGGSYAISVHNGSTWVLSPDSNIALAIDNAQDAQTTADGKAEVFYSSSAPTGMSEGDIWVDTDDGNVSYVYTGSAWVEYSAEVQVWPSDEDLTMYYPLDGSASDESGHDVDGTLNNFGYQAEFRFENNLTDENGGVDITANGTPVYSDGVAGKAIGGVSLQATGHTAGTVGFFAFWAKLSDISGTWNLFDYALGGVDNIFLRTNTNTAVAFQLYIRNDALGTYQNVYSPISSYKPGEFQHFVARWKDGKVDFFQDGEFIGTITSTAGSSWYPSGMTYKLANSVSATGQQTAEFIIGDYYISDAEIRTLYIRPRTPSWFIPGVAGKALSFHETTWVDTGVYLNPTEFTVCLWVKADRWNSLQDMHAVSSYKYGAGGTSDGFYLGQSWQNINDMAAYVALNGAGSVSVGTTGDLIEAGRWYHLAAVFKGGEYLKLYIDGVLYKTNTSGVPASVGLEYPLKLGTRGNTTATYNWYGGIDDVRAYRVALPSAQIKAICKYKTKSVGDLTKDKLEPVMANFPGAITVGFQSASGTTTYLNPGDEDRRLYIDGDEIRWQEYTDGAWSAANSIQIGGVDGDGVFISGVSCRQVVNPLVDEISQEFLPFGNAHYFDFESAIEDQYGRAPDFNTDGIISSSGAKFGTKSFFTSGTKGYLSYNDLIEKNQSFGVCFWIKCTEATESGDLVSYIYNESAYDQYTYKLRLTPDGSGNVLINSFFQVTVASATEYINPSLSMPIDDLTTGFHFLYGGYDFDTQTVYVGVDNLSPATGTVAPFSYSGTAVVNNVGISSYNHHSYTVGEYLTVYMDDLVITGADGFTPDLFRQHYLHDVPWNGDFSAKDVSMVPAAGGYFNQTKIPTKYYAPVTGEESQGTDVYFTTGYGRTIYDASITNAWELADFSSYIPDDAKGLLISIDLTGNSSERALFTWTTDNSETPTSPWTRGQGEIFNFIGADYGRVTRKITVITDNGKFYYCGYNTTYYPASVNIMLMGYKI